VSEHVQECFTAVDWVVLIPQHLHLMTIRELIVPSSVLLVPHARIICVLYKEDAV